MSNSVWDVRARHVGRLWGRHEGGVGALGAGLGVGVVAIIRDVDVVSFASRVILFTTTLRAEIAKFIRSRLYLNTLKIPTCSNLPELPFFYLGS